MYGRIPTLKSSLPPGIAKPINQHPLAIDNAADGSVATGEFPFRPRPSRLVSDPKDLCMAQKAVGRHTDSPADGLSASLGTLLSLPKIIKGGVALASTLQPGNSVTW
jgi:hypothetical protein